MNERNERTTSIIKEMVATYIQHEANPNPLITITAVTVSPDTKHATVYFTTLPDGEEEKAGIFLKRIGSDLRKHLKKKSKLRNVPHIEFAVDAGERHRQHIDEISRDIHRPQQQ